MLEKIRYRLIYNRKKKLNSEGKALVQIECLQQGKRMYLTTKVYLAPEQWENGFVVNHPLADDLNAYLCRSLIDMQRTEFEFIGRGVHPTLAQLKNAVVNSISTSATFADFVASVNKHSVRRGSHTIDSYNTLVRHVERFQHNVTLKDIDIDFLNRFASWSKSQGMSPSTISGRLKSLRAIINEAIARKLITTDDDPFKSFRIPKIKNREESLTMEELDRLARLSLRGCIGHIRDAFLFDCYCGLRYSDLINLSDKDFSIINRKKWIILQTRKTGDTARIPIEQIFRGRAMRILEKYSSVSRLVKIGNNASANRTLKEIFAKAGIAKYAHFHLARHTFITLCIEQGVSITTVQMMVAHSKIETTRGYAKLGLSTIMKEVDRSFKK